MRFNPKMRRRRQAKTDYQARSTLVRQEKNKYNTPKHRFVVRITNKDVVCQVISAKITGDEVLCVAYSHELKRYGLKVGLTNYAACYCTGLLLARRLLKKVGMDDYEGLVETTGEYFMEEADDTAEDSREPFTAFLDVGLRRTTTGSRVFAAMKGATDGGLQVPHRDNGKQFPGYEQDDEGNDQFESSVCRKYIFGGHVGEYMTKMEDESPDAFKKHFSQYIAAGVNADGLEDLYASVHKAIRANPEGLPKKEKKVEVSKYKSKAKLSRAERRDHVLNKILSRRAKSKAQ